MCMQEKLNWLREQIEMRIVGLSWTEWKTPWSSSADESVGTIDQLRAHLEQVLEAEKALVQRGELPCKSTALSSAEALAAECPTPQMRRKTLKTLGTPTVQAAALSSDVTELSADDVLAAALRKRVELEATGEIDMVSDRQPYDAGKGPTPDCSLVGRKLEIRWRYRHKETGEPVYIWCEGEVVQVTDSHKCQRLSFTHAMTCACI